ncbi:hypothetical protein GALMADRAFT_215473 [Galerina marginata CBS 339.88]|uniref:Uncharacterized protein n=1 Tax=Galerina marginata (strain CBS 339.88) TaxID=685588 RepID=A0A067SD89_GALM3|nr:hypothetical protein GALMADRAFT_215473 [Galerina marginata CBS 339.88]
MALISRFHTSWLLNFDLVHWYDLAHLGHVETRQFDMCDRRFLHVLFRVEIGRQRSVHSPASSYAARWVRGLLDNHLRAAPHYEHAKQAGEQRQGWASRTQDLRRGYFGTGVLQRTVDEKPTGSSLERLRVEGYKAAGTGGWRAKRILLGSVGQDARRERGIGRKKPKVSGKVIVRKETIDIDGGGTEPAVRAGKRSKNIHRRHFPGHVDSNLPRGACKRAQPIFV